MKLYNKYFLGLTSFFICFLAGMSQTNYFHNHVLHNKVSLLCYLTSFMLFIFLIYVCIDNHQFSLLGAKTKKNHLKEINRLKEFNAHFKKLKRKTLASHRALLDEEVKVQVLENKMLAIKEISRENLVLTRNLIILGLLMFLICLLSAI